MLYVQQQQYFLHAHSIMSVDVLAVACLGSSSNVADAMYITMLKLSESCHDRTFFVSQTQNTSAAFF